MTADRETARLHALRNYALAEGARLPALDQLTALAAQLCGAPISLVTLIDADRQWYLAQYGIEGSGTARGHAFCAHALARDEMLEVPDAQRDLRFKDNPYVVGDPNVRFYAGMPLFNAEGHALGTLCVIDHRPRQLSAAERGSLRTLRDLAMAHIELRRRTLELERSERRAREIVHNSLGLICTHGLDGTLRSANPAAAAALGLQPDDLVGRPLTEFMHPKDGHLVPGYLERLADIGRDEGHLPVLRADGARRVWRYRSVVSNVAGDEPLVVGHALDVTEDG